MFVGLDVHKKYTEVAIVDEEGVVTKQERIENEPRQIEEFSNRLSNATVVLESSCMHACIETARFNANMNRAPKRVTTVRKDQSKGLLYGMRLAKCPVIVTIDADLENNPAHAHINTANRRI